MAGSDRDHEMSDAFEMMMKPCCSGERDNDSSGGIDTMGNAV